MTWEWSHSPEAYDNARENLDNRLERAENGDRHELAWLAEAYGEWSAGKYDGDYHRWLKAYRQAYRRAVRFIRSDRGVIITESIWDAMADHRACTNGGWEAYACPDGCHLVSFSLEDSE